MKSAPLAAVFLAVVSTGAAAQTGIPSTPLATRGGWEAGVQGAYYRYLEPDFARLSGARGGLVGAYTFAGRSIFSKIDARGSYGRLKYQGSGTSDQVPDFIVELRAIAGGDFAAGSRVSFSPYAGLGYRYLYNDLRGYSSTGAAGYRRHSQYVYAPVGVTVRFDIGGGWVLAPTVEADIFLKGRQTSQLSDTGLGFRDVTNQQDKGYGHRVSFTVEKGHWTFGGWSHYWHVGDSDVQAIGNGFTGLEPENYTRESGLEVRYRF